MKEEEDEAECLTVKYFIQSVIKCSEEIVKV